MRYVLLVDDEPDVRAVMADALAERGYRVHEASDGAEALALLSAGVVPDAIVLDLAMPKMTGWQFRDLQRRLPRIADVPVVVVTASSPLGIDAAAVLEKPFTISELVAALRRVAPAARRDEVAAAARPAPVRSV